MTKRLPEKLLAFARTMRHVGSPVENKLWQKLRNRQLGGYKFRRQFVIGKYIADFACPDIMLIIELDGDTHAEQEIHDACRTRALEAAGYRVMRFGNSAVVKNVQGVLETILAVAEGKARINDFIPSP